jgi:hypothetical protein
VVLKPPETEASLLVWRCQALVHSARLAPAAAGLVVHCLSASGYCAGCSVTLVMLQHVAAFGRQQQAASLAALWLGRPPHQTCNSVFRFGWLPPCRATIICNHRHVHCTSIADQCAVHFIDGNWLLANSKLHPHKGWHAGLRVCSACA